MTSNTVRTSFSFEQHMLKKGQPGVDAPACAGSRKQLCKRLYARLTHDSMVTTLQENMLLPSGKADIKNVTSVNQPQPTEVSLASIGGDDDES
jgi:hypothetical protein